MSDDYVLFYSNKCLHSKELLNLLYKDVDLNQKFTKINIDNPNIKIPPYLKSVPTAIITTNGKPNLLVGSSIFKWYNQTHSKKIETAGIQDWDPHAMSGYSDGFSYIEKEDVLKKSFSFLNDNSAIVTPDESNYTNNSESNKNNQKKNEFDNEYENYINHRNYTVPNPPPKI